MNSNVTDNGNIVNDQDSHGIVKKYFGWIRHVSVEPTMWLYMMAFMTTSVIEQSFFLYKSCRVNHGLDEEFCRNMSQNKTLESDVQSTVTQFQQWNTIADHVVPIILALFLGNWSDRRGRKLPLILGLFSKTIYSGMIVVNALMPNWNLFMIIYTASIPMSLLGGDIAIFASCFAYISDVSSVKQRTLRVTLLDVAYLSTMPTGVALGSYLFTNVVHNSYAIMFSINTLLLILSIIYSLIVLKWQTHPRQQPIQNFNIFSDFFDYEHVKSTVRTLIKSRPQFTRLHLWILFSAMILYTFQRDEKRFSHLYLTRMFQWDITAISKFRTFQSALFVTAMLIVTPVLSKVIGMKDTIIVSIGALSHAAGRIFFATANQSSLFYAGAAVAAIGPVVAPVLRSMSSKVVAIDERGKVFAMLSVCDNAVPLLSGTLYSQLYKTTYNTVPSAIYWLTFSTQIAVLLLILVIHFSSSSNATKSDNYTTNEIYNVENGHEHKDQPIEKCSSSMLDDN